MLVAVPSTEDRNGLVVAEGRQADLQRPFQPCRSDADDRPLWRLSVAEHYLAAGGDGVACSGQEAENLAAAALAGQQPVRDAADRQGAGEKLP
ncbi:hypothetical protein [Streptomyces sp. NRRL F-2580]|uniref:hypothetical protein n=1 Tax=Streptomyces sp. NRRL F-2580 TaxID=1463841 RepID=UPI00131E5006|nr:hypothetical protein [Streptomyces sp. NRRL F-2580]